MSNSVPCSCFVIHNYMCFIEYLCKPHISGIGHGLAVLPSVEPIAFYFTDGFALANGIALGGASIGMMVLPPLTEIFLEVYGWRATFLLLGAIDFHVVFAGALMRTEKQQNEYNPLQIGWRDQKVLEKDKTQKNSRSDLLKEQLIKYLDINLFRNEPMILFYDITIFLFGLVYSVWTVYLVPHAIARGVNEADAAFLSTISGVTNFAGRIVYAPIVDRNLLDSRDMFAVISVINAVMFLTDPLYDTYILLAVSAAVVGFTIGAGNSLWTMMIKQFIKECRTGSFVSALGWACLFQGLANVVSSPISGE